MKPYRESLTRTRKGLKDYRECLEALPDDLSHVKGVIRQLILYPIKGLGGAPVEELETTLEGLKYPGTAFRDRMAMLVYRNPGKLKGETYEYSRLSQREIPELSRIHADLGGETLRLINNTRHGGPRELHGISARHLMAQSSDNSVLVRMGDSGELLRGVVDDGEVGDWLREVIDGIPGHRIDTKDIELVFADPDFERAAEHTSAEEDANTLYSDGGQMLVASHQTLEWLNRQLLQKYQERFRAIYMTAFRPNIVLDGNIPPHLEDLIDVMAIGNVCDAVRLKLTALCVRCPVTQIDSHGQKPDKEPLKTLAKMRPARLHTKNNAATFGVNAFALSEDLGKRIQVGDRFYVCSEKQV